MLIQINKHKKNKSDKSAVKLLNQAKVILQNNWVKVNKEGFGYTKPAALLYPFQWNWDSGFIAYGYSHYDLSRAVAEMRSLFRAQWTNGFLPHIIFHGDSRGYFPGPEVWDSLRSSSTVKLTVATSGITQPPIHAATIWHIYKELKKTKPESSGAESAEQLLAEFYPKLLKLHEYLLTQRDPEGWGLVTIYHPWESGFDNSPRWDEPLSQVTVNPLVKGTYDRQDLQQNINVNTRPTNEDYDIYLTLLGNLRAADYQDGKIYPQHPFKVKDIVFSSILYLANLRLKKIAKVLGEPTGQIDNWLIRFEHNCLSLIWNEDEKLFFDYDVIRQRQIQSRTAASLLPLITGILARDKLLALLNRLELVEIDQGDDDVIGLVPSVSVTEKKFEPQGYWRGPIWININWFLWRSFLLYNLTDRASKMRQDILELVASRGFYEYYNPTNGEGIGASNFSWTAALVIDLLSEHQKL